MWQDIKNIYHFFVSLSANIYYGFPGKKLTVIGVTGTDGKTTTANLIYQILKSNNYSVAISSSVSTEINNTSFDTEFHRTTPTPTRLQYFLRKAVNSGAKYLVLEVTSHAIDQYRIWGIPFKVGVLTNVSNEHLDYHKTYENYAKTKRKLLENSEIKVINIDDKSFDFMKDLPGKKILYGLSEKAEINSKKFFIKSDVLIGDFNQLNALAAIGATKAIGLSTNEIMNSIKNIKLPKGRLDFVYKKDFWVVIDFAHTPNAFRQLLSSLRPLVKGRLIHVFGSAGERDKEKRSEMGKISNEFSDIIILTSEDPRSEDVAVINEQIERGVDDKNKIQKIPDRELAIKRAIEIAQKGDLVLLTGKAHEKSMNYGKGEVPWDEYKVVKEALEIK